MRLLSNMRIWQKAILPLVILGLACGGITFFMSGRISSIDTAYSALIDNDATAAIQASRADTNTSDLWALAYQTIAESDVPKMQDLIKQMEAKKGEYEEHLAKIGKALGNDPEIETQLKGLDAKFTKAQQSAIQAGTLSLKNTTEANAAALKMMHEEFDPLNKAIGDTSEAFFTSVRAQLTKKSDDLTATTNGVRFQAVGIAIAAISACLVVGLWVAFKGMVGPLNTLNAAMAGLARREWHTGIEGEARGDEIGAMARTLAIFRQSGVDADRLAVAEADAQKQRQARTTRLEHLVSGFETKISQVVGMVSSASTELEATAQSMSSTATQSNQQATTVTVAAERASAGVSTTAAAAEELASSIGEISRQVAQSASVTSQAVADARRTDGIVKALAEGASKIGQVVELITNIAGQTNLLALNATIEAARAGEAGKGFAVVASEVKSLAHQTATATEQIRTQIGQIQGATGEAVEAIRAINAKIEEISSIASSIASAVEEQGAATSEIARNVQQTAANTQEVTANIAGVSRAANDTGVAADQVLGAAGELARKAQELSHEVNGFISDVRAA